MAQVDPDPVVQLNAVVAQKFQALADEYGVEIEVDPYTQQVSFNCEDDDLVMELIGRIEKIVDDHGGSVC